MFRKLYSLNKDRKSFSVWTIEVIENKIITSFGKLNGKMQTKEEVILEGKNIGRSNSTTPSQQAISEAQSTLNKKWDGMYRETMEEAERAYYENLKPQLSHDYLKPNNAKKINFPCYVQPKYDGVRMIIKNTNGTQEGVKFLSRELKPFPVNEGLFNQLIDLILEYNVPFLDGEYYLHNTPFEEIISCVKKPEGKDIKDKIEFHIFDVPNEKTYDQIIHEDFIRLNGIIHNKNLDRIKIVDSYLVDNFESAKELMEEFLLNSFEGIMFRNIDHVYEFSERSSGCQKYKLFFDDEYKIINVVPDKEGRGMFVCKDYNSGQTFRVTPKMTHEKRFLLLEDKENLIGKMLNVKYQNLSEEGIPRFGVGMYIREGGI